MASNSDRYLEKQEVITLNNGELKTVVPLKWFTSHKVPPKNLIISCNSNSVDTNIVKYEPEGFKVKRFANLARFEAQKNPIGHPESEARKYTQAIEVYFGRSRFPWCGAFIHWLLNSFGVKCPTKTDDSLNEYTFALVENWQHVAKVRGWYFDNDGMFQPQPGDLVIFDWNQIDINQSDRDYEDHIGVFIEMKEKRFICAEGNTRKGNVRNIANLCLRDAIDIQGFIRIPLGTTKIQSRDVDN